MRTREYVAATINIGRRRMDQITLSQLLVQVSRGAHATLDEAIAEWLQVDDHDPRDARPAATAAEVDAHVTELYAGLRRSFASYQALSPAWPEDVRRRYYAEMYDRQEWLMAMGDQLGRELDAQAVEAAEQDIERDMYARRKAAA